MLTSIPVESLSITKIKEIARLFARGNIGVFPTDTVYGVGCALSREDAIERLYQIKKRPEHQPTALLIDSFAQVKEFFRDVPEEAKRLMKTYWPGALTIVFPCRKEGISSRLQGKGGTIGVRMPDYDILRTIIRTLGEPLVATSANFKGEETPVLYSDIKKEFLDLVDFCLEGVVEGSKASTVVEIVDGAVHVLRQGDVKV
ncbi:MAG TPA: L-threonylcarbamoyladenylate synthase [Patescibacteria group bacterium]|nr:L-threonylcarbamoyladenylate synthase [Patescibacteria group bacterium]